MVALRRSSGSGSSAPGGPGAGAPVSDVPHSMQNLASGGFSVAQLGHAVASGAPQDMQKRARSGFSVPHEPQVMGLG